jgi:HlyD family secretion protein
MSKGKKITIAVVVLAIVAVVGASSLKGRNTATEVRIEGVTNQDLVASVTASGQVSAQKKVDLSAEITGKITRLSVKEGDFVRQGQFLLQIDPEQYEAAVQRAGASLANARASLEQSRANQQQ